MVHMQCICMKAAFLTVMVSMPKNCFSDRIPVGWKCRKIPLALIRLFISLVFHLQSLQTRWVVSMSHRNYIPTLSFITNPLLPRIFQLFQFFQCLSGSPGTPYHRKARSLAINHCPSSVAMFFNAKRCSYQPGGEFVVVCTMQIIRSIENVLI
jgi:hypothetical protein